MKVDIKAGDYDTIVFYPETEIEFTYIKGFVRSRSGTTSNYARVGEGWGAVGLEYNDSLIRKVGKK